MADIVIVPVAEPVKLNAQEAEAPLPPSVHDPLAGDTPAPLAFRVMLPVGVTAGTGEVSLTVTVQLLDWPIATGLAQLTDVDVARLVTVALPFAGPLVPCFASPP